MVKRYQWFVHSAPVSAFDSIKKIGLEPRPVRRLFQPVPTVVQRRIPINFDRVVFLWPKGDSILVVGGDENEKLFQLGLEPADLPVRLGVDWSFDRPWERAAELRAQYPHRDIGEIFAHVAESYASFLVYDPIPPEALVVRLKGQPHNDPKDWKPLLQSDISEIEQI